jgi:hypothetical protein
MNLDLYIWEWIDAKRYDMERKKFIINRLPISLSIYGYFLVFTVIKVFIMQLILVNLTLLFIKICISLLVIDI